MLNNKELYALVTTTYSDYGYDGVDNDVIKRYVDNYEPKVNYHSLLLNGKDRIELEVARSVDDLLREVNDYIIDRLPISFYNYVLSTFDADTDVTLVKGKLLIKGVRLHKYIADIHKGYKDYLVETYNNNYTTVDINTFMSARNVAKDNLDIILQKLTIEVKIKVVISARPDDFILCSENTTGWQSCFRIDGEYHNSTNSFYCDNRFLVSYILSSSGRKIGRRWLHIDYEKEIVSNGKPYGTYGLGVAKGVREHIQKLIDNIATWVSYENTCNNNDACGIYCDSGYRTSYKKSNGKPNKWSIYEYLPDGLNRNGASGEGVFADDDSCVCPDCGDRFHREDAYYIESRDESICDACGSNNYYWCDGYDVYVGYDEDYIDVGCYRYCADYAIHNGYAVRLDNGDLVASDEAIWLEDMQEWVHESEEYYCDDSSGHCWSMDYFRENFVMASDIGEYIHKDNANYSDILDEYFEDLSAMEKAENENTN